MRKLPLTCNNASIINKTVIITIFTCGDILIPQRLHEGLANFRVGSEGGNRVRGYQSRGAMHNFGFARQQIFGFVFVHAF